MATTTVSFTVNAGVHVTARRFEGAGSLRWSIHVEQGDLFLTALGSSKRELLDFVDRLRDAVESLPAGS